MNPNLNNKMNLSPQDKIDLKLVLLFLAVLAFVISFPHILAHVYTRNMPPMPYDYHATPSNYVPDEPDESDD